MSDVGPALPDEVPELVSERLRLVPLTVADADELVDALSDERLHQFIGGQPASLDELRTRFAALAAGSGRDDERWWNWVVRRRDGGQAIGTAQVTLLGGAASWSALVAWVVGTPWQGQGYASEAATALVRWLQQAGVDDVAAHIHPDHGASSAVATRAGLHATTELADGEVVWRA